MAFLRYRSVYCIPEEEISIGQRRVFSAVCIATATLSAYGACVQLRSWNRLIKDYESRRKPSSNPVMAFCLALADLFTCIGVIAMSIIFITMDPPFTEEMFVPTLGKKLNVTTTKHWYMYVGAPIESFTMFSYVSSYLWTFGYALDICLQIYDKDTSIRMRAYQIVFWLVPVWLVVWGQIGYFTLSNEYCSTKSQEILHYMVCFVPLVCVFLVLPFIYLLAYRKVRKNVKFAHACYTNAERQLLFAVRKKFFRIWLVFVLCWITNVVDGFLDVHELFKSGSQAYIVENEEISPHSVAHFPIWMIEAVLNPLQGFLNCLVYGQSTELTQCWRNCFNPPQTQYAEVCCSQTTTDTIENYLINSHDRLETSSIQPQYNSYRSSNTSTVGLSTESPNEKRFVARLLGEPRIT